jgi:hypothetical protein
MSQPEWRVTTRQPGCYIFLLDQSLSMEDPIGGSALKKSVALADAINRFIAELISQCEKGGARPKHYFDVALIGYTTDDQNNPIVGSAFQGALATGDELIGLDIVGIDQLSECPLGTKDEGGALVPVWYEPVARYGTPMCRALEYCEKIASMWSANHMDSVPPIVIHITDGESSDGDPLAAATALQNVRTHKGGTLLFNIHLSDESAPGTLFPSSEAPLPNDYARMLFRMSSPLPDFCVQMAQQLGWQVGAGARGMAFNTDATALSTLLAVGTLPSGALR